MRETFSRRAYKVSIKPGLKSNSLHNPFSKFRIKQRKLKLLICPYQDVVRDPYVGGGKKLFVQFTFS